MASGAYTAQGGAVGGGRAIEYTPDGLGAYLSMSFVDYPHKTVNIDRWNDPTFNRNDNLFEAFGFAGWEYGPLTNNTPVDVVSWTGAGHMGMSGMAYWQDCLSLFMRMK